jgi:cytidylate kinase
MITAVVLTGPPGAGKTSVLEKLATLLETDGVAFGALESEHLGWGRPWLSGEPWRAQLRSVLALQRQAGRRLFLIAATTETDDDLAAVAAATAADHVTTVLLTAPADVIAARLQSREPDTWPGKRQLITHARTLAIAMTTLAEIDIRIDTEARQAIEVAEQLRDHLRDLGVLSTRPPAAASPFLPPDQP